MLRPNESMLLNCRDWELMITCEKLELPTNHTSAALTKKPISTVRAPIVEV